MTLRDETAALLRSSKGGWKEFVQKNSPEAVTAAMIDIIGTSIAKGRNPKMVIALDLVMQKKQHISDVDLLFMLEEL